MEALLEANDDLGAVLHYDSETRVLGIEDPQFVFFIRNLLWNKFASASETPDQLRLVRRPRLLSFAGADLGAIAHQLFELLSEMEFEVFYDRNEQSRFSPRTSRTISVRSTGPKLATS